MKLISAGNIGKPHALKALLNAFIEPLIAYRIKKLDLIFLEEKGAQLPYSVEEYSINDESGFCQLKLESIDDRTAAEKLKGKKIFLDETKLKKSDKLRDSSFLIGYLVVDAELGDVGRVTDVFQMPTQNIIQIQHEEKEVLIPLVDEYEVTIDNRRKEIRLNIPDGLLNV